MSANGALALLTFATAALLSGIALQWRAIARYGRDLPRWPGLNTKYWKPIWKFRDHFQNDWGFDLFMWGGELIQLGAIAAVIYFWSKL